MKLDDLLRSVTTAWADDPSSDVAWAGEHEGRHGVRMRQTVRDFTTVWFTSGDRTVAIEAGVLPEPRFHHEAIWHQCLRRNQSMRFVHFAVQPDGEIVLVGRLANDEVSDETLQTVLAEIWDMIEVSFRALARLAFTREKEV